jgi:hypothetical protein
MILNGEKKEAVKWGKVMKSKRKLAGSMRIGAKEKG